MLFLLFLYLNGLPLMHVLLFSLQLFVDRLASPAPVIRQKSHRMPRCHGSSHLGLVVRRRACSHRRFKQSAGLGSPSPSGLHEHGDT